MEFSVPQVVNPLLCLVLHHHYRGATVSVGGGHRTQGLLGMRDQFVSNPSCTPSRERYTYSELSVCVVRCVLPTAVDPFKRGDRIKALCGL
jgi:hypothetical protein